MEGKGIIGQDRMGWDGIRIGLRDAPPALADEAPLLAARGALRQGPHDVEVVQEDLLRGNRRRRCCVYPFVYFIVCCLS